jgi:hypothetical protein
VFGDERGKITTSTTDEEDLEWARFKRRRAGRMAAKKGVNSRLEVIAGASHFAFQKLADIERLF